MKGESDELFLARFALREEQSHNKLANKKIEFYRETLEKVRTCAGVPGHILKLVEDALDREDLYWE